jgi:stage III sporulation protein AG
VDFFSKLKEQFNKLKPQKLNLNSKLVINLAVILALGIGFILVSDFYKDLRLSDAAPPDRDSSPVSEQRRTGSSDYVTALEERLTGILSKIQHTGKVSVMITLKTGTELIPAKDESVSDKTTNEKDMEGGTRTIAEKSTSDQVVFKNNQGGASEPLVLKEINPEIKGVIIVAEGAQDPKVKQELSNAVQTVLDIPAYRVSVFESNK